LNFWDATLTLQPNAHLDKHARTMFSTSLTHKRRHDDSSYTFPWSYTKCFEATNWYKVLEAIVPLPARVPRSMT
jgi:hypothetical protein